MPELTGPAPRSVKRLRTVAHDKEVVATKGLKEGQCSRSSIKAQLVHTPKQPTTLEMDVDTEIDLFTWERLHSPPTSPARDCVDWTNSQSVELQSLLSEVSRKPSKRPIKSETTWPAYDSYDSNPIDTKAGPGRSRPLRRTNSIARARLGSGSSTSLHPPPPAPDVSFWGKDRHAILAACQNFSERMDENALQRVSNQALPLKRAGDAAFPSRAHQMIRRSTLPHAAERREPNWQEKGKQATTSLTEPKTIYPEHLSESSPSSTAGSSSSNFSSNITSDTSLESADATMLDIESNEAIPLPPRNDHSHDILPAPKLHPLLIQKPPISRQDSTKHHSASTSGLRRPPTPEPAPPSTQSTRPRVLGMRRVHNAPTAQQHNLPTRQKGFKPPLLSQTIPRSVPVEPAPSKSTNLNASVPQSKSSHSTTKPGRAQNLSHAPHSPQHEKAQSYHSSPSSPEINLDADSSFGDMSFDLEELEATMRQYD